MSLMGTCADFHDRDDHGCKGRANPALPNTPLIRHRHIPLLDIVRLGCILEPSPTGGAAVSLRKSPTLTPARLEANRRNAKKSTGPRTARGKAHSSLNSLRTGTRSAVYQNFFELMLDAPPCKVHLVAQALLSPAQAAHPVFAETVELFRWAEGGTAAICVELPATMRRAQKKSPRKSASEA